MQLCLGSQVQGNVPTLGLTAHLNGRFWVVALELLLLVQKLLDFFHFLEVHIAVQQQRCVFLVRLAFFVNNFQVLRQVVD